MYCPISKLRYTALQTFAVHHLLASRPTVLQTADLTGKSCYTSLASPEVEILSALASKVAFMVWYKKAAQDWILRSLSIELDLPVVRCGFLYSAGKLMYSDNTVSTENYQTEGTL